MNWHDIAMMGAPTLAVIVSAILAHGQRKKYANEVHITLNSRLTELIKTARLQAFAEGQIKGAEDSRYQKDSASFDTIE